MSRAFVKDDAEVPQPRRSYALPPPNSPGYEAAVASTLLEAARAGETSAAEQATGYRWGDPSLRPHVRQILEAEQSRPEEEQDRRLIQLARRFLRAG